MKFKATVTAPSWSSATTFKGLPRAVKGIGTAKVEGDDFLQIEDIIPKVPLVDGLGRELHDGDELTILESPEGVINIYCPKFADGFVLEVPDIVVDFDGYYEAGGVVSGVPVFGTVYIKSFTGRYSQSLHPTTNSEGINFDGGYYSTSTAFRLDASNRIAAFYDSRALYGLSAARTWSIQYGAENPDDSIFYEATADSAFTVVNKTFHFLNIYTRTAPTMQFIQDDE